MKFYLLGLTFFILNSNLLAMTTNDSLTCTLNMVFERNQLMMNSTHEDIPEHNYLYTGHGELTCDKDRPFTVFTAIRLNKKNINSKDIKNFELKFSNFKINSILHVFQTYNLTTWHYEPSIKFAGNTHYPSLAIDGKLSSPEINTNELNNDFLISLHDSILLIEQDQFYPEYN